MPLFDTHCHLDFAEFDANRTKVLASAQANGVHRILVPGVAAEHWPRLMALAQQQPSSIKVALGLHPFWTQQHHDQHLTQLRNLVQQQPTGLVAIGECGLDAVVAPELMERQLELLEAQLALAVEFNLPVILHVRKAHPQLQSLLKRFHGIRGVIHGFSGSYELGQSYLALGMKLGIGGTLTYPRARKTRDAVSRLPLEALVLETDAPDMPICGKQGQLNRPDYLPEIFNVLTKLRKEPVEEVERQLWQNSLVLF